MTIEADREEMSKLIQRIEPLEKERDSMAELGLWEQVVDIDAEIKPLRDRYNMLIDKIIQRTRGIHNHERRAHQEVRGVENGESSIMSKYYCYCETPLPEDLGKNLKTCYVCGGIIRDAKRPLTGNPLPSPKPNGGTAERVPQEGPDLLRKRAESCQDSNLIFFCTPKEMLPLLDEIESLRRTQAVPQPALVRESGEASP